ncbi:Beta-hexosaminidase [Salinispira pacifica]|uniref:beta-N-acetylhexosaminidase n=1 Tax=Salinispira pacifica TaxID=1307761 RepID=V5WKS0_9SPIO|nr:Beta-hexosaminidase [Salinispira pacifica]
MYLNGEKKTVEDVLSVFAPLFEPFVPLVQGSPKHDGSQPGPGIRGPEHISLKIDRDGFSRDVHTHMDSSYRLKIGEHEIEISAGGHSGMIYAFSSLLQLCASEGGNGAGLPAMEISDSPVFSHRGLMLDVSRHFFNVSTVKKLLDLMVVLKMNVFHWHLSDDQGWRVESFTFPELNTISSRREKTASKSRPVGGYYTHDEIREVVRYAGMRGIEIIPEFDMPGHVSAILAAFPQLSCRGVHGPVPGDFGIFEDVACAGKDEVYGFFSTLLDEILPLFPGPRVHLGGDEVPKSRWKECPRCQEKIRSEALKDEEDLQAFFMNSMIRVLNRHGKTCVAWNEAFYSPAMEDSAIMQFWREDGGAQLSNTALHGDRKVILSDFWHYYLDYPHGMTPFNKTWSYIPRIPNMKPEDAERIIGIEAPLWTEYVPNEERLYAMILPRIFALAETAWGRKSPEKFKNVLRRLERLELMLARIGYSGTPVRKASPGGIRAFFQLFRFFVPISWSRFLGTLKELKREGRR